MSIEELARLFRWEIHLTFHNCVWLPTGGREMYLAAKHLHFPFCLLVRCFVVTRAIWESSTTRYRHPARRKLDYYRLI